MRATTSASAIRALGRGLSLLAALLALAACSGQAPPSPPVERPTLTRPTITLSDVPNARIFVPAAAIVNRGGAPGVFVVSDGQARFRMIKTGKARGNQVEIISGLRGDETLVLGDLEPVHDGSPIEMASRG